LTKDDEEGADQDQYAEVACVVDWAGKRADKDEQEGLYGADPGDVGGGRGIEEAGFVVGLVDTLRVVRLS